MLLLLFDQINESESESVCGHFPAWSMLRGVVSPDHSSSSWTILKRFSLSSLANMCTKSYKGGLKSYSFPIFPHRHGRFPIVLGNIVIC